MTAVDRLRGVFSIEPLFRALGVRTDSPSAQRELGEKCGASRNAIYRGIRFGLSVNMADRLACGAGLHPAVIWPDWYSTTAEQLELEVVE